MLEVEFLPIQFAQLKIVLQWAADEGWNPGINDAEIFWHTDPQAFYGIFYAGKLIGGGAIVQYNQQFGFMGLFIVLPEYRSKGLGKYLWYKRRDTLLNRLPKNASIGMDAVLAMQPFYAQGGFHLAFKDERHLLKGRHFEICKNITEINSSDFEHILAFDKLCFSTNRNQFLKAWLFQSQSYSFKYTADDKIQGFIVLRKALHGYKIGPLFANNYQVAEELLKAGLNVVNGSDVFMDIPTANKSAIELMKTMNTEIVFECGRMYYGKPFDLPIEKIFGLTSLELG